MPSRSSQDRPFRVRTVALLTGVIAVSLAARSQQQPATTTATPPAQPPAAAPAATPPAAAQADSLAPKDTSAVTVMDSSVGMNPPGATVHLNHTPAEPVAAAPATWPVDPATGQTLINGEPVVGKVFIMQKTDGTKKIETVAQARAGEPDAPAPAVVGRMTAPGASETRRIRTVMVQATLWMEDHKKAAVRRRQYGPTTSGESLGQQY